MYCKNCKYYNPGNKLCTHPKAVKEWYPHMGWIYYKEAQEMRKYSNLCGQKGKLYIDNDDVLRQKDVITHFPSCRDCKYLKLNKSWYAENNQLYYAHCSHPNAMLSTDMVTGNIEYETAKNMRKDKDGDMKVCGTIGLLFEQATPSELSLQKEPVDIYYAPKLILFVCAFLIFCLLLSNNQFFLAYIFGMAVVYFSLLLKNT